MRDRRHRMLVANNFGAAVAEAAPPAFPSLTGGYLEQFRSPVPVNGTDLAVYNAARFGAITNFTTARIGQHSDWLDEGYAADVGGNVNVGNRILDAPTATKFDITVRKAGNTQGTPGICFNMTTNDRTTADGYFIGFGTFAGAQLHAELWKIVNGAFDTKLDSTSAIAFLALDQVGLRWFGDGTWQMYYSANAGTVGNPAPADGAWTTTGTPGSDTTYLAAGNVWATARWASAADTLSGLIDGYSLGTW